MHYTVTEVDIHSSDMVCLCLLGLHCSDIMVCLCLD